MNHTKKIVWAGIVMGVLLLSVAGVFAFSLGKYEKVTASGGTVSIPTSRLSGGKARFYRFEDGGKSIAFFVVKAPDGSYRTAFDACDVCYREKKGYDQQGAQMLCKNCNRKFAIDRIAPGSGEGCNPSFLPHQASGGAIIIKTADLKAGARFF